MVTPEGYTPIIAAEEEDQPDKTNELCYLLGVLYLEASVVKGKENQWVFESHKTCLEGKMTKFEDIGSCLGKIYSRAIIEKEQQDQALVNADNELKKSIEEQVKKKQEDAKKATKKNTKKKETKADLKVEEPPAEAYQSMDSK